MFSGGQNWFMDFNAAEGDRVEGLDSAYLREHGRVQTHGEHTAVYFGETPWDPHGPGTIWLAGHTSLPDPDVLLA